MRMKNFKQTKDVKSKMKILAFILFAVLVMYSLSLIIPFIWAVINSFKGRFDFALYPFAFPKKWQFSNYTKAFEFFKVTISDSSGMKTVFLKDMYLNSALYSFGCALISAFVPMVLGYMTARYKYKFSGFLVVLNITVMLLPIYGNMASGIQMAKMLGIYNTIWGQWISAAGWTGLSFMVYHATFASLPKDFAEAAMVDGASHFAVMKLLLPLVFNTYFTFFLIGFIGYWNDYQTALIYMPSKPTIAYGLFLFTNSSASSLSSAPMQLTGAMFVLLPILIIFILFSKRIMGGVIVGGLKG